LQGHLNGKTGMRKNDEVVSNFGENSTHIEKDGLTYINNASSKYNTLSKIETSINTRFRDLHSNESQL
jgi:SET domain-containing protein